MESFRREEDFDLRRAVYEDTLIKYPTFFDFAFPSKVTRVHVTAFYDPTCIQRQAPSPKQR